MNLPAVIFHDPLDLEPILAILIRLAVAVVLGGVIGFERQLVRKSAGMRTHMLVSLGSAMFTAGAVYGGMTIDDLSRVIQGVATGIGFLGAGAILKGNDEDKVRGLTTAASIWLTAAAGLSVGAGYLVPALIAIVLGWIVLEPVEWFEIRFLKPRKNA